MPDTLRTEPARTVLATLRSRAAHEDPAAKARVSEREGVLGRRLAAAERYELYLEAPLAVSPPVGELFQLLATASAPGTIVEFGASHGISTLYLAAGLRDGGGGSLITTELMPVKAKAAEENLKRAGLSDLVEVRLGDALHTLSDLSGPIDLLVLDGRNDQYVPVLELLRARLSAPALVLADLGSDDPDLIAYQAHMRRPESGFHSLELPLGHGVEVSARVIEIRG
jgi:predicted O-methyltransferase YrrM